ncbi:MAG TPA: hypothetical protein ENL20_08970 [Candidatus Cloacimonetes bacterium]|nr:hypothetical protein [Candidatus Cloacimonadota bacterium]
MKKLFFPIIFIVLFILVLSSCSAGKYIPVNYYILEYYPHLEKEELRQDEPFDLSVLVLDTKIPKTYSRSQIVIRHFGPKITYSEKDIWGVKLANIIPDLINKRLVNYNIFRQVQREFLNTKPDYEISTVLNNIELYLYEDVQIARLNMDFYLSKSGEETYLVHHSVNKEEKLFDDNVETFVLKINDLILNETDNFISNMVHYLKFGSEKETIVQKEERDSSFVSYPDLELRHSGLGSLLLPAITRSNNEPYFIIYDQNGNEIKTAKMGTAVALKDGIYSVSYGSGSERQMMTKENIKVIPQYKTIIEPDWGCLTVDIIDERRDFIQMRYELFDLETGESYGTELTAEEEVGEQQKIWLLRPGMYKITLNNESFNTYRDFSTVFVEKGEVQKLTIVVATDEEGNPTNLIGSGVIEESEIGASSDKLKFSSAVHGNVNINSNNETDKDNPETTITLNTQFDSRLVYDKDPFHYTLKNLIELGTSKEPDMDFRLSSDDFDLKNTFIFYFLKNIGLYARADLNSHFFDKNNYESNLNYVKVNTNDQVIEVAENQDKIKLKSPFFPLKLKEGVGINWRIMNYSKANLNLRSGFGMQQDINNDYYVCSEGDSLEIDYQDHAIYREQESVNKEGLELSLIGSFLLPFNLTYTTNADVLFPIEKEENISMEWENIFNLKLFKYISLDYKLKFENQEQDGGDDYIMMEQSLFLRLTYILR